jgi:hypothetical protein
MPVTVVDFESIHVCEACAYGTGVQCKREKYNPSTRFTELPPTGNVFVPVLFGCYPPRSGHTLFRVVGTRLLYEMFAEHLLPRCAFAAMKFILEAMRMEAHEFFDAIINAPATIGLEYCWSIFGREPSCDNMTFAKDNLLERRFIQGTMDLCVPEFGIDAATKFTGTHMPDQECRHWYNLMEINTKGRLEEVASDVYRKHSLVVLVEHRAAGTYTNNVSLNKASAGPLVPYGDKLQGLYVYHAAGHGDFVLTRKKANMLHRFLLDMQTVPAPEREEKMGLLLVICERTRMLAAYAHCSKLTLDDGEYCTDL